MGYLDLVGSFTYGEPLFRSKLDALAENDAQLKLDGWAQNTKTLFCQAAVPVGWTQDVSQNDKMLRIVGSTGGAVSGGSQALSNTVVIAHTHSLPIVTGDENGFHDHDFDDHTHATGPTAPAAGLSTQYIYIGTNLEYTSATLVGGAAKKLIIGLWPSTGSLTISQTGTHDHGAVTGSSLTDFVFAYCDVILGTKDAPAGTYTDLTTYWHTGDKADFDPFVQYANNDVYNLGNRMPAGTVMIFGQAAAPTGWTRTGAVNDRMLRVVSTAGGGTGGSRLLSNGVALAHSNAIAVEPDHTHTFPNHVHTLEESVTTTNLSGVGEVMEALSGEHLALEATSGALASRTVYTPNTDNDGGTSTGAAGSHTHALASALADFIMAYVDVIQCSKDAAGEPYAYADATTTFAWKKLISKQRLDRLARNDSAIRYHTTPSGTKALFYMPTPPIGWTKMTDQHDKVMRVVTGATGGTPGGGSHLASDTMVLAHTHSIPEAVEHQHTATHQHVVASTTLVNTFPATDTNIYAQRSFAPSQATLSAYNPAGGSGVASYFNRHTESGVGSVDPSGEHEHGGVTDTALTNVSLAYADVIYCRKD